MIKELIRKNYLLPSPLLLDWDPRYSRPLRCKLESSPRTARYERFTLPSLPNPHPSCCAWSSRSSAPTGLARSRPVQPAAPRTEIFCGAAASHKLKLWVVFSSIRGGPLGQRWKIDAAPMPGNVLKLELLTPCRGLDRKTKPPQPFAGRSLAFLRPRSCSI